MFRRFSSSPPLTPRARWALLCVIPAIACTGQVSDSPRTTPKPEEPPGTTPDPTPPDSEAWAPALPFRRIANDEWVYSVADLLQLDEQTLWKSVHRRLPAEEVGETRFAVPTAIGIEDMERLLEAARLVVRDPIAKANGLCENVPAADAKTCQTEALLDFAAKAFRRPLRDDEQADLSALFEGILQATEDVSAAMHEARAAVLVSPSFLYHDVASDNASDASNAAARLPSQELAARLASWLWRSVPDAELRTTALEDRLQDPEELSRQIRRMLSDKKARRTMHAFYRALLHVEGLAGQVRNVPKEEFSPAIAADLEAELEQYIDSIVFEGDGRLTTLLTSTQARLTPELAKRYKASSSDTSLRPQQRSGVLSLGAVMAALATADEGSPIKRGHLIREKWLCETLPAPPADIPPLPPPSATQPGRQRIEAHASVPACAGCHRLMDPIGFAFSAFDAAGQFHEEEAGQPIDTSGSLIDVDETTIAFRDLPDFAQRFSQTEQVRSCAVKQWARFFLGRLEDESETKALAKVQENFASNHTNLLDLLHALVMESGFRSGPAAQAMETHRDE